MGNYGAYQDDARKIVSDLREAGKLDEVMNRKDVRVDPIGKSWREAAEHNAEKCHQLNERIERLKAVLEVVTKLEPDEGLSCAALWHLKAMAQAAMNHVGVVGNTQNTMGSSEKAQ